MSPHAFSSHRVSSYNAVGPVLGSEAKEETRDIPVLKELQIWERRQSHGWAFAVTPTVGYGRSAEKCWSFVCVCTYMHMCDMTEAPEPTQMNPERLQSSFHFPTQLIYSNRRQAALDRDQV